MLVEFQEDYVEEFQKKCFEEFHEKSQGEFLNIFLEKIF